MGENISRRDTTEGAAALIRTAQHLLDLNLRTEDVRGMAVQGIKALQDRTPGLLYPGDTERESEESRSRFISRFRIIQAEAQQRLGQNEETEVLLREAAQDFASWRSHFALGRFLESKGNLNEAYQHLVSALAVGLPSEATRAEVQRLISQILPKLNKSDTSLTEDIAAHRLQIEAAAERKLIANRIDQPAHSFNLKDTVGKTWSLAELHGKIVVVNCWSMYCKFCVEEFPHYRDLVNGYQEDKDLVFLAISMDTDSTAAKRG